MHALFVIIVLFFVITALIKDRMRPGLILFSGAVVFMCAGILSPKELLEGFANKGMITVAMLFLVSEGVRRSGCSKHSCAVCCHTSKAQVSGKCKHACCR